MTTDPGAVPRVPVWELAELAELVYEDWGKVRVALDARDMDLLAIWDRRGTQGMLTQARRLDGSTAWAAISFRGTEASKGSAIDLWRNLTRPWPVAWMGPGRCHAGYRNALSAIALDAAEMAKRVPSEIPLYVDGHSMGGGIGTEFVAWYGQAYPEWKLAGLVTTGATKALDARGCAAIRCPVHRLVMPGDFAPHWPPAWGLTHPSTQAPGEIRLTPPHWWPGPVSRHHAGRYAGAAREL